MASNGEEKSPASRIGNMAPASRIEPSLARKYNPRFRWRNWSVPLVNEPTCHIELFLVSSPFRVVFLLQKIRASLTKGSVFRFPVFREAWMPKPCVCLVRAYLFLCYLSPAWVVTSIGLFKPPKPGDCRMFLAAKDPLQIAEATYEEALVPVAEGARLRVMRWTPHAPRHEETFLFVAGWVSVVQGWADLIRRMAVERRPVVYVETREKASAELALGVASA